MVEITLYMRRWAGKLGTMNVIRLLCFVIIQATLSCNTGAAPAAANDTISYKHSSEFREGLKAYELHNDEVALTNFNKFLKQFPDSSFGYVDRAVVTARLGRPAAEQISDLNRAISLDSNLSEAHYNRGNTYLRLRLFAQAIDDYSFVVKKNPADAEALKNIGAARLKSGDLFGGLIDSIHGDLLNVNKTLSKSQFSKSLWLPSLK